jgi:hypothetical protein
METNTWSTLRDRLGIDVGARSSASAPSTLRPMTSRPDPAVASGHRQTIGRYVVLRELSAGPMYRVLLAEDPLARRPVAVKTLRWEHVTNDNVAFCLARLDRQAQTAGRLCHPQIVKVFDRGSDYLVLEYLQGLSLSTILRERGRMNLDDALRVLGPLASALDHMHARGVVHRDVQPGNVIVLADGSPRLIDFGASCLVDRPLETWDRLLGTPSHMAPEQVLHGVANAATDVFSFGVLAYELLTGEQPFRGDSVGSVTYRVVYEKAPPPSRWTDALPRVYDEIFARVLAKEPERRLSSAGAFVRALQGARDRRRGTTTGAQAALQEDQARDLLRLQQTMPGTAPEACVVEVHTEPEGAQVFWNGVERGLTPLRVCETTAGPHTLKLVREGYTPVEAGFMVPDAPSLRLQFTMVPTAAGRLLEFRPRRDVETA